MVVLGFFGGGSRWWLKGGERVGGVGLTPFLGFFWGNLNWEILRREREIVCVNSDIGVSCFHTFGQQEEDITQILEKVVLLLHRLIKFWKKLTILVNMDDK